MNIFRHRKPITVTFKFPVSWRDVRGSRDLDISATIQRQWGVITSRSERRLQERGTMSIRSKLRGQAILRADFHCEWPAHDEHGCTGKLEMSHIVPSGSGGADTLANVWMLCRTAHAQYDGREPRRTREWRLLALAYIELKHGDAE